MPKAIMIVTSSPSSAEREDEYNDWYDNTHLEDVLAIPGVTGARRYRASEATPKRQSGHEYCAVYELDVDDVTTVLGELGVRAQDGRMRMSDSLQMDPPPSVTVYELRD